MAFVCAEKELDSEEDGVDEEGKEYLKTLAKKVWPLVGVERVFVKGPLLLIALLSYMSLGHLALHP